MAQDSEKRLRLIRQQLYGKETVSSIKYQVLREQKEKNTDSPNTKYLIPNADINFLHQDLFKITYLAALAVGTQIILFILAKNRILNLSFF